jgi:hypothetical protein
MELIMPIELTAPQPSVRNTLMQPEDADLFREFLLLLSFSLSPLAVLFMLWYFGGADRLPMMIECSEIVCAGM